ncbi:hypothetical protein V6N12_049982 [Hibiscus sabdariffa]|uniref:Uncharacterized protein n=1 Tax=Hibiscus sabdariffa TaxID=183260 RepID=A0ABR2GCT7_9ROSI
MVSPSTARSLNSSPPIQQLSLAAAERKSDDRSTSEPLPDPSQSKSSDTPSIRRRNPPVGLAASSSSSSSLPADTAGTFTEEQVLIVKQIRKKKVTDREANLVGSDEHVYVRRASPYRGAGNRFNSFYDTDFDADEIFRNFFFGGMPPATTQFRSFNFGPGMGARTGDQGSIGFNI